uniref:Uncharacterized protein n=1 Tax=Arundo donax TaxID=35708 RepID=A0A0A8YSF9_ARUDO
MNNSFIPTYLASANYFLLIQCATMLYNPISQYQVLY